jgi:hypothetical protein
MVIAPLLRLALLVGVILFAISLADRQKRRPAARRRFYTGSLPCYLITQTVVLNWYQAPGTLLAQLVTKFVVGFALWLVLWTLWRIITSIRTRSTGRATLMKKSV